MIHWRTLLLQILRHPILIANPQVFRLHLQSLHIRLQVYGSRFTPRLMATESSFAQRVLCFQALSELT